MNLVDYFAKTEIFWSIDLGAMLESRFLFFGKLKSFLMNLTKQTIIEIINRQQASYYSILLIEILLLIKVNQFLLLILSIINLLILAVYLAVSLKKVFGHTWLCTIIRMTFASLILFTLYQFIHYTISFNSGR